MIKNFLQKIFKKITYYLFFRIYGEIKTSIKVNSDERIEVDVTKIENLEYKTYKITNGRLYTDRIHDTAIILENKIIEGPSFQLRYNNNSPISNNIVFQKGTPRILRNLNGSVVSLLTGGGGNDNYWHWLFDVLPRLEICKKTKKLNEIDYFIVPSLEKKFQRETLSSLNISNKKILSSKKFRHVKANKLIVTDHPYIFTNDSHKDAENIPEWIIKWLRERFLENSKPLNKNYPKKIFIDRTDPKSSASKIRSIVNEKEIKIFLEKKNFVFVKMHELSFTDQVNYFNNADFIIGLHGGGFANLSFCKKNTKVIEFRTEKSGPIIENLAKKNSLKYDSIIINLDKSDYDKQSGHLNIPLNRIEEKINEV